MKPGPGDRILRDRILGDRILGHWILGEWNSNNKILEMPGRSNASGSDNWILGPWLPNNVHPSGTLDCGKMDSEQ